MNTYSEPDHLTGYCADARVAIVDNDERALESVVSLFADRLTQIDVIWSTTEGLRAIKSCKEHELKPDLLLLDMSLEGIQGPSVCRGIRRFDGRIMILAMTSFSVNYYASVVKLSGAQGIVSKNDEDDLLKAICRVLLGNPSHQ